MDEERSIIEAGGQVEETRPIEVITAEIQILKQRAGEDILGIGQRLIEAKAQLSHGEWLPWLENEVRFSEASAQRFMRLAKAYSNPSALTDLGASKALILLGLPDSEREEFAAEKHEVNGQEKSILEMTTRELEQAVKDLKNAKKALEQANEDLDSAMTEKDEFAEAAAALEEQVADLRRQVRVLEEENETQRETAGDAIAQLNAKIEALESAPKEVTATETVIEKVVDHEEEDRLRAEIARLEGNLKAAEDVRRSAATEGDRRIKEAKDKGREALEKARSESESRINALNMEKAALQEKIEALQKQVRSSSAGVQVFKVHFQQAQETVAKMLAAVAEMETDGSAEDAARLKKACVAYADHVEGAFGKWREG